ncbi:MAG: hypothetical protein HQL58_05040 [Magnetococcales bacterium]|nr:hypothetical protein [Magnetococcales bacterium]
MATPKPAATKPAVAQKPAATKPAAIPKPAAPAAKSTMARKGANKGR